MRQKWPLNFNNCFLGIASSHHCVVCKYICSHFNPLERVTWYASLWDYECCNTNVNTHWEEGGNNKKVNSADISHAKRGRHCSLAKMHFFAIINHYSAVFSMAMKLQTKHYIRVMILFANTHTTLAQWGFIFNDNAFSLRFLFPLGKK